MKKRYATEEKRRYYWQEMMEAGYDFMMKIMDYPVQECRESLVSLPGVLKGTGIKVYFSRRRLMKTQPSIFRLRSGLVKDFLALAQAINRQGLVLRIEDAYRTSKMQNPLNRKETVLKEIIRRLLWEKKSQNLTPEFIFRRLTVLITTIPKIGTHMSGSALDISVLFQSKKRELERGGHYLEMSEFTPMDSPFISTAARKNRWKINGLMLEYGFHAYPFEFWHYSSGDAYAEYLSGSGQPGRYGPVDLVPNSNGRVKHIKNPKKPLISPDEIGEKLSKILCQPIFPGRSSLKR